MYEMNDQKSLAIRSYQEAIQRLTVTDKKRFVYEAKVEALQR
ncbi:hypothetical protein [Pseudoalteromonas xiamenensis]